MAIAVQELVASGLDVFGDHDCRLICDNFLPALDALQGQQVATVLPDYLSLPTGSKSFLRVRMTGISSRIFSSRLAWNPRLLRLNSHAARRKDFLNKAIAEQIAAI